MTGLLDVDKHEVVPQVSRFDKLDSPFTGPNMKPQLDAILELGWNLIGIYNINGNDFAVYTRPKKQV